MLSILAYGFLTPAHVGMFLAFTKQLGNKYLLRDIIKGTAKFPSKLEERDVLYFIAQSFRALLLQELPRKKQKMSREAQNLTYRAKALIKELSSINYEIAQMVVSSDGDEVLPDWFMLEIVRDLPRLVNSDGRTP